jgi:acyl-CoA synthetase (AMP-forming)/AMP-acid ligase II
MPEPRSVNNVIDRAAEVHRDQRAVVTDERSITYGELHQRSLQLAGGLAEAGVSPGDRIAASLPNDIEIVVAFYAAARLGAIWVGINRQLAPPEKAHILDDTRPVMLIAEEATIAPLSDRLAEIGCRAVPVDVGEDWQGLCSGDPVEHAPVDPLGPAAIAYTSGTSGFPKGVIHSQHNLVLPGEILTATRGYDSSYRRGDFLSLTILNMIVLTTLTAAQAGGTSVLTEITRPDELAPWIREHAITTFNGVPTTIHGFVTSEAIDPTDLESLNEVWSGGAPCPEDLRQGFMKRYGKPIHSTYGLTEAPTLVSIDHLGRPGPAGASGVPLPHLEVTIGPVAEGHEGGEVIVGATTDGEWAGVWQPFLGYWNRPGVDVPVVDGRLHTGDVGRIEDGYLVIVDRLSSVILRGGANVYPAEVERVVRGIDAVADVVVVGVPDERLGETVQALVELEEGQSTSEEHIIDVCRAELARYKVPKRALLVDAIERNAMGKPDRRAAIARLQSQETK